MILPQFVDGPNGRLLFTLFRPQTDPVTPGVVLCLPPFAEEMNKSRRMLALLGRSLARNGHTFLLPDLYGTGDSEGDFADADFDIWTKDVSFAYEWLDSQKYQRIDVLAVRFGSLLVDPLLDLSVQSYQKLVMWNPVTSGTKLLNQFLRTKLAAAMQIGEKSSVADIRTQIEQVGAVEIAGYVISDRMVSSIDASTFGDSGSNSALHCLWADVGATDEGPAPPKAQAILSTLRDTGCEAQYRRIKGPQFWVSPEIREVEKLVDVTADFFVETK